MEAVLADDRLQGLRQVVLATKDAQGLYEKFGFKAIGNGDASFMRIFRPPSEIY
jgi:N-acetylglutamate synthase-like GNAT family acetyltransferase